MLRDDRQAALNEVIALCKQTRDHYADAAERVPGTGLAALFREYASRRGEMAAHLSEHIKRIHDLPRAPDRDRETIQHVVSRLRGLVSADERLLLLDERERDDQALASSIAMALQEELPADTLALLRRYHREVMDARDRLAVAKTEL